MTGPGLKNAELKAYRTPPGTVITREDLAPIGWEKSQILAIPQCSPPAEAVFDGTPYVKRGLAGLCVYICSVIGRHRFAYNIIVEVEAFLLEYRTRSGTELTSRSA